ncbi:MAG: NADH-quinone oxidoreductase subunit NuoH [Phycisphaerales bacterium]
MFDFVTPQLVTSVIVILLILHMMLGACAYLIMLERKLSAWIQDRVGPNRVGPAGLLQPLADGLKFIMKEEFFPRGADRALFLLAPCLIIIPALIGFAVIPWAGQLDLSSLPFGLADRLNVSGQSVAIVAADVNIGVIYLLAVASLGVYGVVLGGWASNSKYSFFGALRASAQMISYEIPMGLAILAIVLFSGTIIPGEMVEKQLEGAWFLLHQPIAAVLFYTCMLAENNRAPFDMAEAESELVGGYHTEYSSMKFALFFLAEYAHMIVGSAFFVVMFLGGWSLNPLGIGPDLPAEGGIMMILMQFGVVCGKIFLVISLTMAIRWTLPRFRFDQLMRLAWEGMIPTGLAIVLATSFVVYFGWQESMWAVSLGLIVVIWLIHPWMPRAEHPNARIPMLGSRFSPLPGERTRTAPRDPLALAESGVPEDSSGIVSMH